MSAKPKVAFYWCSSCGGCEEAVVDLAEGILDVAAAVDIVLWPVALDFKYKDVEAMADGSIAVSFINGAIRTSEQKHIARLLRRKSGLVVAFGACSSSGGIPALANLTSKKAIFDAAYHHSPTIVDPKGPEPLTSSKDGDVPLTLPEFYESVHKLSDVIDVDYYLPGCAPVPDLIAKAVNAILTGKLPPKGAVLSPGKSLCSTCERNETKPEDIAIGSVKRVIETAVDPKSCFLAQGIICMGPATRDGCGRPCINGNMPCTGCFGPTDDCKDQGGKMIGMLGGVLDGEDEATAEKAAGTIVDPAGTFYRYGMAASLLGNKRREEN
jgi:F420-non-reducing hydrogenase small subunit